MRIRGRRAGSRGLAPRNCNKLDRRPGARRMNLGGAEMAYQDPTLFGLAYASRLFRRIDEPSSFDEFRRKTGGSADLKKPDQAEALLRWLNRWNCRIDVKSFPSLRSALKRQFPAWEQTFPGNRVN